MKFFFGGGTDTSTVGPGMLLLSSIAKFTLAVTFLYAAYDRVYSSNEDTLQGNEDFVFPHRRLQETNGIPSYMQPMMKDLEDRKKLFRESPPEEVKYWFEYSGPLQVSLCLSIMMIVAIPGVCWKHEL